MLHPTPHLTTPAIPEALHGCFTAPMPCSHPPSALANRTDGTLCCCHIPGHTIFHGLPNSIIIQVRGEYITSTSSHFNSINVKPDHAAGISRTSHMVPRAIHEAATAFDLENTMGIIQSAEQKVGKCLGWGDGGRNFSRHPAPPTDAGSQPNLLIS